MHDFVKYKEEADAHDAWFRTRVEASRAAANAGDVLSAEEVEAEATAWREGIRGKLSES